MQEKIAELNKKIDALQEKLSKNAVSFDKKKDATKEQIEAEIEEARKSVEVANEKVKANAEDAKNTASAEFAKIQDGFDKAKQKLADRKEARDQAKLAKYIDNTADYAASCIEAAFLFADEARLATLEVIAAQKEYDEKYGK